VFPGRLCGSGGDSTTPPICRPRFHLDGSAGQGNPSNSAPLPCDQRKEQRIFQKMASHARSRGKQCRFRNSLRQNSLSTGTGNEFARTGNGDTQAVNFKYRNCLAPPQLRERHLVRMLIAVPVGVVMR
jgi:hypothetical protein